VIVASSFPVWASWVQFVLVILIAAVVVFGLRSR